VGIGMEISEMVSVRSWEWKGEYVAEMIELEGLRMDMISGRMSGDRVMFMIRLNSIRSLSSFFSFLFTKHILTPFYPLLFTKIYPVCFPTDVTKL